MKFKEELGKLIGYMGSDEDAFEKQFIFMRENFTTPEQISQMEKGIQVQLDESAKRIDDFIEDAKVKLQLSPVMEIVSLSYISEKYFNRTRNWLYQKVNGNKVNGKPARFTENEINTLNFAIQDISKKLGSTVISL
ncbi:MAG: DUF5053 domain-containing protein [Dysgonamonadaceae bacterium]|jgi:hypothetical protein|nr:DUF5053 domain-containing protein [Dysgonamonadaceae bacterium]